MNNGIQSKKELRLALKAAVKFIPASERALRAAEAIKQIETHPYFKNARSVMAFYPLPDEVDISPALPRWAKEKQLYLPALENGIIVPRLYTQEMEQGELGTSQPVGNNVVAPQLDLIIVPGLGFTNDGLRLGRGKGCYDRFLSSTPAKTLGLCHKEQILPSLPTEAHDVKLCYVISC